MQKKIYIALSVVIALVFAAGTALGIYNAYKNYVLSTVSDEVYYVVEAGDSVEMLWNNHVGDSFATTAKLNGKRFYKGVVFKINVIYAFGRPREEGLTIEYIITEYDSINDTGTETVELSLSDFINGYTGETEVIVRENRGRYAGNTAGFNVSVTFEMCDETEADYEINIIRYINAPKHF